MAQGRPGDSADGAPDRERLERLQLDNKLFCGVFRRVASVVIICAYNGVLLLAHDVASKAIITQETRHGGRLAPKP
jgi:hypothetical protein